ncbi:AraC family transcriptional regulator [uncultured Alphaproteobacteria bacterium]|uniref:AraC family transcriptional regulator n=1 Tax=uncultured Alphaproteobacteria bacterium TaxID=91750 RepID=A0A212K3I9_9PROT|nr:AraC family transcriptional regulator [uncultured Alphaproteobacteria bacterium]
MPDDLKSLISAAADAYGPGAPDIRTPVPGLAVVRAYAPSAPFRTLYHPVVCVVAQGAKRVMSGEAIHDFAAGQSLIVGIDVPVTAQVVTASAEAPYLAAAVDLDPAILREVIDAADAAPRAEAPAPGILVGPPDAALADCVARLVRLTAEPSALGVLHPLLLRELHFRLLQGPHGAALRRSARLGGRAAGVARAIRRLREGFARALTVEELAADAGMSPSTFHLHFKTATGLTPMQFQKQLRLLEARRLLTVEAATAERAAYAVGYESATQFSREYARMFGAPPKRDAALLRSA